MAYHEKRGNANERPDGAGEHIVWRNIVCVHPGDPQFAIDGVRLKGRVHVRGNPLAVVSHKQRELSFGYPINWVHSRVKEGLTYLVTPSNMMVWVSAAIFCPANHGDIEYRKDTSRFRQVFPVSTAISSRNFALR